MLSFAFAGLVPPSSRLDPVVSLGDLHSFAGVLGRLRQGKPLRAISIGGSVTGIAERMPALRTATALACSRSNRLLRPARVAGSLLWWLHRLGL